MLESANKTVGRVGEECLEARSTKEELKKQIEALQIKLEVGQPILQHHDYVLICRQVAWWFTWMGWWLWQVAKETAEKNEEERLSSSGNMVHVDVVADLERW